MFGFSIEHVIILAIVLILFGPRRLPELGNKLGVALKNFKDALQGIEDAHYRKVTEEKTPPSPVETQKKAHTTQNKIKTTQKSSVSQESSSA